ncbi:MAG: VOC family protein [Armatimonadota bacterium]
MIRGMHALFYSPKAEEMRTFIRDKLGLPYTDAGGGWLIFDVPEADMGCHPSDRTFHEISFYCDDLAATVEQLKQRGVEFTSEIADKGWGLTTTFRMPGDVKVLLYQPKYPKPARLRA